MLHFVGDINFTDGFFDTGFGVGTAIKKGLNPFRFIERNPSDIWIGNFECVCSDISNKSGVYAKQFIIKPSHLRDIQHLDIYNLANNHVMQHGHEAYLFMQNYLGSKNIPYFGSLTRKSFCFEHSNYTFAITGFSQRPDNFSKEVFYWERPEYSQISDEYQKIQHCDYKIAYIHWGIEFINYPSFDQKQFAHYLIDLGYDLIIGMHAHVAQGMETYKGKKIFYSLGNFVFNMSWYKTKYSLLVSLNPENDFSISVRYVKIGKDYCPKIVSEESIPNEVQLDYLNNLLLVKEDNEVYYSKARKALSNYRKANYFDLIKNIFKFNIKDLFDILKDFIKRKIK